MPRYQIIDYIYPTAGELARLILAYKQVEFLDEQVETPDRIYEAEEDSPFGILPVLLVDGKIVGQQQGICRYLAKELGLTGRSNEEAAVCDMIMDGLGVMFAKLRGSHISKLDGKQQVKYTEEPKRVAHLHVISMEESDIIKKLIAEDVPRFLAKYEEFLEKENHTSGYFASEDLTWCDLGVGLTLAGMQIRQANLLEKYPRLQQFVKKIMANKVVEKFVNTRHSSAKPPAQETTSV